MGCMGQFQSTRLYIGLSVCVHTSVCMFVWVHFDIIPPVILEKVTCLLDLSLLVNKWRYWTRSVVLKECLGTSEGSQDLFRLSLKSKLFSWWFKGIIFLFHFHVLTRLHWSFPEMSCHMMISSVWMYAYFFLVVLKLVLVLVSNTTNTIIYNPHKIYWVLNNFELWKDILRSNNLRTAGLDYLCLGGF